MQHLELVLWLLVVVTALAALAERLHVPYPMLLLAGGIVLTFIPGLPSVTLDPGLALFLFLPPILFSAAYSTSWRDFWSNRRPIGLLAFGLVLFTTVLVAWIAHALIPGISWAAAFVLGAIVSPPDAVAATAIFQRLGVPTRIVTILEGESLVNDASALIAYRFALAAVVTGAFSPWHAVFQFILLLFGGILLGVVAGFLLSRAIGYVREPSLETAVTMLAPYGIYIAAEQLGFSGVLATVAAGLYFGRQAPVVLTPAARLRGETIWQFFVLLINGLVFILIGLELADIRATIAGNDLWPLVWHGVVISLAVIVIRILWVFPATYLPRWLVPGLRRNDPAPNWRLTFIVSWSGLRGVVSLASALALPTLTDQGVPFDHRHEIIVIAFIVIIVTLFGQGLPLDWLITRLNIPADDRIQREELLARRAAAQAALAKLDEIGDEMWVPQDHLEEMRTRYRHIVDHMPEGPSGELEELHTRAYLKLRGIARDASRQALIDLRNRGVIGDEARRRVESTIDLDELRLEA